MIKEITQACITTLINGYERQINNEHIQIYTRMALKDVIGDLGDFLDYIADLKEDVQANEENTEEYSIYVRRIQELEMANKTLINENRRYYDGAKEVQELKKQLANANESIENLQDNEKRVMQSRDKIIYELRKTLVQNGTDLLTMEENQRKTFRLYKIKHEKCNELRDELAKLRGPQWVD